MICYIKSMKDFKTIEYYNITEYSISDGEDGSVKVNTKVPVKDAAIYSGCWMVIPYLEKVREEIPYSFLSAENNGGIEVNINGPNLKIKEQEIEGGGIEYSIESFNMIPKQNVYYIYECMPENDSLTFTIRHPIYAFTRRILYTGETTWGTFIKKVLTDGFGYGCADWRYAMHYLVVEGESDLECEIETDNFGYFVPCDYFEYARKVGINIDFSVQSNDRLLVNISNANDDYGIVLFNDGHSQLADETYAANSYSKITIIQELNTQSPVIAKSESKKVGNYDANIFLEVSQDVANSYSKRKSMLLVRVVSSWEATATPVEFKNCEIEVKLASISGESLLSTTFDWEIKEDASYATTEWFSLSQLNETTNCTLFVSLIPDRYPNNEEASTYSTLSYTINVDDIIPRSSIKFGPLDSDYNCSMYRLVDFYLSKAGEISLDPPLDLEDGEWIVNDATSDELPYNIAADIFSQNSDNHKIEFYSDQYFEYYQPIRMRIRSGVFDTMVTSRTVSSSDYRYYYKCGRLLTRITEKIRALS